MAQTVLFEARSSDRPARRSEAQEQSGRDRAASLAHELASRIEGEVRFDDGSRALYASDLSIYRQVPSAW